MTTPVCVVVPTYNRAALIGETLESILDQTLAPTEVIVVDDGSVDDTESIIKRLSSEIKYLRIDNSGVCNARNIGVSLTVSPLIAFCDSDDLWTRDKLEKQVALHEQYGIEYSFTNYRIVSNGKWECSTKFDTAPLGFFNDFERIPQVLIARRAYYDDFLRFLPVFPSTAMILRSLYYSIGGFKPELGRYRAEDWEFSLRCVQRAPFGVIDKPVVGIRKHAQNFSGDAYLNSCGEVAIFQYALQNHNLSQGSKELIAEQIIERTIEAGGGAFTQADFKGCLKLFSSVPRVQLDFKAKIKLLISSLPVPIAKAIHMLLTHSNPRRTAQ
jgi:glycosyltransferase involved in cell wall biosynthesis